MQNPPTTAVEAREQIRSLNVSLSAKELRGNEQDMRKLLITELAGIKAEGKKLAQEQAANAIPGNN